MTRPSHFLHQGFLMPVRILLAEIKQETSVFNPRLTLYEDFHQAHGDDLLSARRGTDTEIAGALDVFSDAEEEILPIGGMAAWAVSGGPIRDSDLDRLIDEFTEAVTHHSDIDAVYFCLHGAMAGEQEGDPEGRILKRAHDVLGDTIPTVVSLDLHAIFTPLMHQNADVFVPFHTYPHTDQYETGRRSASALLRLIRGEATPTNARISLPMLVRGDELLTATGLFGDAIRMCQDVENSGSGLAAGVLIGNPFTDVPGLKSWVEITTNADQSLADQAAERIAKFLWDQRERLEAELVSLETAISTSNNTQGLTVFSDAADATASGASGDSNAILSGLIGRSADVSSSFQGTALLSVVDAPAAHAATDAGVGASVEVSLGGTRDPGRFVPLPVTATVLSIHDGHFTYESGKPETAGATAVLRIATDNGHVDALVTERSVYVVGQAVFTSHGLDPASYDMVVAKSPNGFRTHYESIAAAILAVDVPGSTSANLHSLPFSRCPRPIFPLDEHVPTPAFVPEAPLPS